jgi:hypothetical protein
MAGLTILAALCASATVQANLEYEKFSVKSLFRHFANLAQDPPSFHVVQHFLESFFS